MPEKTNITFTVGDVHGCLDKLQRLLKKCEHHAHNATLVMLGDYIDRGPDSCRVVTLLKAGLPGYSFQHKVFLKGNHEAMMYQAIVMGVDRKLWMINGGDTTVASYKDAKGELDLPLITNHAKWLGKLPTHWSDGHRYYVHAGINPDRELHQQKEEEQLWIRDKFLNSEKDHGKLIIHGHTPEDKPTFNENRIGLDTGAVFGGKLTAAVFEDESRYPIDFIQV